MSFEEPRRVTARNVSNHIGMTITYLTTAGPSAIDTYQVEAPATTRTVMKTVRSVHPAVSLKRSIEQIMEMFRDEERGRHPVLEVMEMAATETLESLNDLLATQMDAADEETILRFARQTLHRMKTVVVGIASGAL